MEYLSPSSIATYRQDEDAFFEKYMAIERPPRLAQTVPMAVGSAFDAYVKSYIGKAFGFPAFEFERLFKAQVEPQNRALARVDGLTVFNFYKSSGALQDLMVLLGVSSTIQMEERVIRIVEDVPICGIPDLLFCSGDLQIILDWKVNGFYSKASPKAGYVDVYPGRLHHKSIFPVDHYGHKASVSFETDSPWAVQSTVYGWLLGLPVGHRALQVIHQIAWGKTPRVAIHAGVTSVVWQQNLHAEYAALWKRVSNPNAWDLDRLNRLAKMNTDPIFRELTSAQRNY